MCASARRFLGNHSHLIIIALMQHMRLKMNRDEPLTMGQRHNVVSHYAAGAYVISPDHFHPSKS